MGWTSRRLGLTIDNMLSVELVTANGQILHVDPDTDPELFWGLSGGGGNFGVVTGFRFRLHPLGTVTVGKWQYGPEMVKQGLLAMADLAAGMPRTVTTVINVERRADPVRCPYRHGWL
jgi:FAD/FMN-containing dehydrogenase